MSNYPSPTFQAKAYIQQYETKLKISVRITTECDGNLVYFSSQYNLIKGKTADETSWICECHRTTL